MPDTTPDRTTGFNPASITSAITDIEPLLDALNNVTSSDLDSNTWIDSILTKGLATVALFHPGLNVGAWEPLIASVSMGVVVLESGVRAFAKSHSTTQALKAVTAALTASPATPAPMTAPASTIGPTVAA